MTAAANELRTLHEPAGAVLRCAIIGCGEVTLQYLRAYRDLNWVQVTHCVDICIDRAQQAARTVSEGQVVPARASADYRIALGSDVDVVMISTPNHLHSEHAIAAMKAGKHVLLQKPVAPTFEQSLEILRTAREHQRHGVCAGVYMSYLEQPAIQEVIAMSRQGCFGRLTQIHGRVMHRAGLDWSRLKSEERDGHTNLWRSSIEQTGGGAFIQLAVHYLRLFRLICGESIVSVQGYIANLQCPNLEGEDTAAALLEFDSGACATLNLSWCATGEDLSLSGTEGTATYLDNHDLTIQMQGDWYSERILYTGGDRRTYHFEAVDLGNASSPYNQHAQFLQAVRGGGKIAVPLRDGVEDMAVVSAFYKSVRSGRVEPVPEIPKDIAFDILL